MNEICGDNRFEIIEKAKMDILDSTNISSSQDEMKVLDSFLFRCWQMRWLKKYDNSQPQTNATDPNDFCGVLCDFAEGLIAKAKAEAIKEFAERLKDKAHFSDDFGEAAVSCYDMDNLVKEMVGDHDG